MLTLLTIISLIGWGCSKDTWNNHYDGNGQNTIKDVISGLRQKGYNEFAAALEKVNLGSAINSGMRFTIFAVPDQQFKQAASNLSDDDLKFLVLNHILPGKYYSSSFTDSIYTALGGNTLYIWMNGDSIGNFYKESSHIVTKDVDIANAVLFELSKCIKIYPNLNYYLSKNYSFFSDLYKSYFVPDLVQYPLVLGVSSTGVTIDTTYRYSNMFSLTNTKRNLTFVVSKNEYAVPVYNGLLSMYLPYFIGGEYFIRNDIATGTRLSHVVVSATYNTTKDSLKINTLKGNRLTYPVSKVKTEIMDNGDKLLVIDTMLYNYSLVEIKNRSLLFNSDSTKGFLSDKNIITSGNFNKVAKGVVTWKTVPLPGDYIEYTIPSDSIYSSSYDLFLQYTYKSSYVQVKIYFDGDSLQNRFDLGSITGAISKPPYYQFNIATGFNIKRYSTHTIRLEVAATKGSATEIMSLGYLVLKLNN